MKKVLLICLFVLLCGTSYSQQKENKIIMLPISTNDSIKRTCEALDFRQHLPLILYFCSTSSNIIYTSLVQDTVPADIFIQIRLNFTDTLDYFLIKNIYRVTPQVVISNSNEEKQFINELIFEMMKDSTFYYNGKKEELEGKEPIFLFSFKFIPSNSIKNL